MPGLPILFWRMTTGQSGARLRRGSRHRCRRGGRSRCAHRPVHPFERLAANLAAPQFRVLRHDRRQRVKAIRECPTRGIFDCYRVARPARGRLLNSGPGVWGRPARYHRPVGFLAPHLLARGDIFATKRTGADRFSCEPHNLTPARSEIVLQRKLNLPHTGPRSGDRAEVCRRRLVRTAPARIGRSQFHMIRRVEHL